MAKKKKKASGKKASVKAKRAGKKRKAPMPKAAGFGSVGCNGGKQ
jgi:hypothetical protein